nr:hypothetical protein CFP56_44357 [Quercus suber]
MARVHLEHASIPVSTPRCTCFNPPTILYTPTKDENFFSSPATAWHSQALDLLISNHLPRSRVLIEVSRDVAMRSGSKSPTAVYTSGGRHGPNCSDDGTGTGANADDMFCHRTSSVFEIH